MVVIVNRLNTQEVYKHPLFIDLALGKKPLRIETVKYLTYFINILRFR